MEPVLLRRRVMPERSLLQARKILAALIVAFALVALAFIGSSVAAFAVSQRIEAGAYDLLDNALPSVTELLHAMGAEDRLTANVQALSRTQVPVADTAEEITTARGELDASLAAAMRTPDYAGEREFFDREIRPRATAVDRAVDELLDVLGRNPAGGGAVAEAATGVDGAARDLDVAMRSLAQLNQTHAHDAAAAVLRSRLAAVNVGIYLELGSALLAVAAAAAVYRAGRRFAARAEEHVARETERARELDTFAQRVAHDLLNPLAGMSFSLDSLARKHDDPDTTRVVGNAKRALERARRMIEGIYAFSKSGARPEPGATAPLRTTVREAVDDVLSAEGESPPTIQVEPFDDLKVAMDRSVLCVLVVNLLSNAAKYTRECPVRRITVRASARADRMHVEVEDTGPGVPAGMEHAIFEPYRRAPGATQPGLGLGLATVKRIVRSHGGDVGVRRAAKIGSVFWFELPLGAVPRGQPAPTLSKPSPAH